MDSTGEVGICVGTLAAKRRETISLVELSTRKPKDAEPGKWVVFFGFLSKPNYCYVGPGAGSVASSVHLCSLLVREY